MTGYGTTADCIMTRDTPTARAGAPGPDMCLNPGEFIESDNAAIADFAQKAAMNAETDKERALRLYKAVRDGITYTPYRNYLEDAAYSAAACLEEKQGWCVQKAALLAAAARAIGIPARVGFADVKNHLSSPRLLEMLGTDVFYWHGYCELWLNGRWIKATPAFDLGLCEKFGVLALEFDGEHDSIFQPFDAAGRRHMEYLADRGSYADVPARLIRADFMKYYPRIMEQSGDISGNLHREAEAAGR